MPPKIWKGVASKTRVNRNTWVFSSCAAQRAHYPLITEYALNYRGLNIMILGIFLK